MNNEARADMINELATLVAPWAMNTPSIFLARRKVKEIVNTYMPEYESDRAVPEPDAARKLSVTFACGSQEYWDLEPDGSIHLDIRQDQAVVSSDHLSEPDEDAVERVADAIFDVDIDVFPDSVRHIPDRKIYLDRARAALQAAGSNGWLKEGTMLDKLKEAAISGRPFMLTVRDDDGEKQYRFWPEEMIKATNDGVKEIEWMP